MSSNMAVYLLAIRGTLASKTLEASRVLHNQTAGAPQNVAAARSLGDLSHMVYVPLDPAAQASGEFLILDVWNNLDGLNQFFANKQVQEQAGQIFSQRDPVVWTPAEGFFSYHFPAPYGKPDRFVAIVRGKVRSQPEAQAAHNAIVGQSVNGVRAVGDMSHEAYFRVAAPGSPESLEFLAVDIWMDGAGLAKTYQDPQLMEGFSKLFTAPPSATVWRHPAGDWVEW